MKIIETTFEKLPTKCLLIGFEGENLRATVRIDCASVFAEYPNATPALIVKPLFADAYPVVVDRNGVCVDWLITSEILSFNGDGEIQLVFYKDQVICKSAVSKIRVSRSLTVTGEMPDPVAQWIDDANAKLAEVDAALVSIDEMDATAHGLPEGSAPTAEVQTVDDHKRIVLGIPVGATGAKGDKGDKGDTGATGAQGIQGEKGDRGEKGDKGDTGEKGDTGATGATGATPDLSIGTVSTLPAGSSATAEITGTAENPVLSLGIPQGAQGVQGVQGEKGDPGDGVPAGGLKGQVLAKASDTDRDTEWIHVAPVIKNTASGAIASFPDGADGHPIDELKVQIEPVQDLHGYDHPWPAGGGKNLFNPTASAFAVSDLYHGQLIGAGNGESVALSLVDKGNNADISGVYFGLSGNGVNSSDGIFWLISNGNVGTLSNVRTNMPYVTIYGNLENTLAKILARFNVQAELATAPTEWTPYSNICPITGWDGVQVNRTGKNLWGGEKLADDIAAKVTGAVKSATAKTITYAAQAIDKVVLFERFKPNTQYTVILNGTGYANMQFMYSDGTTQTFGGTLSTTSKEFTSTSSKSIVALTGLWSSGQTVLNYEQCGLFDGVITVDNFMPYAGTTYSIALPTEAGTVYGGTLDVSTGELVVDRAEVDLGTLTWASAWGGFATYGLTDAKYTREQYAMNMICSEYPVTSYINRADKTLYGCDPNGQGNYNFVAVQDSSYPDASTFKTAMSGVQLVYELQTPITYTLTASEIRTLLGTNNVWADTGDVAVKYNADTKLYIDGKIAELVAQIVNS